MRMHKQNKYTVTKYSVAGYYKSNYSRKIKLDRRREGYKG